MTRKTKELACWSVAFAAAIAMNATLPLRADTYQFIRSGDPVAAATEYSRSAASAATSLTTATCAVPTATAALEARYRTIDESDGIALRTGKVIPLAITFR